MSRCICGKELELGDKVVWRCEDCARKQAEEYDNKDQRIAELEEQLKNSRVKFFLGYDSEFNMVVKELNLNFILPAWMHNKDFRFYDTPKEAQAKLEELKGE